MLLMKNHEKLLRAIKKTKDIELLSAFEKIMSMSENLKSQMQINWDEWKFISVFMDDINDSIPFDQRKQICQVADEIYDFDNDFEILNSEMMKNHSFLFDPIVNSTGSKIHSKLEEVIRDIIEDKRDYKDWIKNFNEKYHLKEGNGIHLLFPQQDNENYLVKKLNKIDYFFKNNRQYQLLQAVFSLGYNVAALEVKSNNYDKKAYEKIISDTKPNTKTKNYKYGKEINDSFNSYLKKNQSDRQAKINAYSDFWNNHPDLDEKCEKPKRNSDKKPKIEYRNETLRRWHTEYLESIKSSLRFFV